MKQALMSSPASPTEGVGGSLGVGDGAAAVVADQSLSPLSGLGSAGAP